MKKLSRRQWLQGAGLALGASTHPVAARVLVASDEQSKSKSESKSDSDSKPKSDHGHKKEHSKK